MFPVISAPIFKVFYHACSILPCVLRETRERELSRKICPNLPPNLVVHATIGPSHPMTMHIDNNGNGALERF